MNSRSWTAVLLLVALALPACTKGGDNVQSHGGAAVPNRVTKAPKAESSPGYAVSGKAVSGVPPPQEDFGPKIVKTADLGITSNDVRGGAEKALQVAARFGGTIVSSQTYRSDKAVCADLVISVPSGKFEDALGKLRNLGERVTMDTVSGQDVTGEYVDLASQKRNLLAAKQTLLDLYNRAKDVQDALSIQRELTSVRGQIEQVKGRMQYLKQSSDQPGSRSASVLLRALRNHDRPGTPR